MGSPQNELIRDVYDKLVSQKRGQPRRYKLKESDIVTVVKEAKELIRKEPMVLRVQAPIKICGDIHGQYDDLLQLLLLGGLPDKDAKMRYLFLGDYVDRGSEGVECMTLLLCMRVLFPAQVFLLRGNHECSAISRIYGFYEECKRRFSIKLWKEFVECFNFLPVCALVEEKIFCMHGGLSPELSALSDVENIKRPIDIPDEGILCDLLWSDPQVGVVGWEENERGVSFVFGADVINMFLDKFNFDLVC